MQPKEETIIDLRTLRGQLVQPLALSFNLEQPQAISSAMHMARLSEVLSHGNQINHLFEQDADGKFEIWDEKNDQTLWPLPTYDTEDIYTGLFVQDELTDVLNGCSIWPACVHTLFSANIASQQDSTACFRLTYKLICKYLGLDRLNISKQEKIRRLLSAVKASSQWACSVPGPNKSKRDYATDRVWYVDLQETKNESGETVDFVVIVRAGEWTRHYLNRSKPKGRLQLTYITLELLQMAVRYAQKRPGVSRLSLWLLYKFRQDGAKERSCRVITVLLKAYGQERVQEAIDNKRCRYKLQQTWIEDLKLLQSYGWDIRFINWPEELTLNLDEEETTRKAKSYFSDLLNLSIMILPPVEIKQLMDPLKSQPKKSKKAVYKR